MEAIMLATRFDGSWAIPVAHAWSAVPLWADGWPRHAVVTAIDCVMAIGVSTTIIRGVRGLPRRVAMPLRYGGGCW